MEKDVSIGLTAIMPTGTLMVYGCCRLRTVCAVATGIANGQSDGLPDSLKGMPALSRSEINEIETPIAAGDGISGIQKQAR